MDEFCLLPPLARESGNDMVENGETLIDEAALGQQFLSVVDLSLAARQIDENGAGFLHHLVLFFEIRVGV